MCIKGSEVDMYNERGQVIPKAPEMPTKELSGIATVFLWIFKVVSWLVMFVIAIVGIIGILMFMNEIGISFGAY